MSQLAMRNFLLISVMAAAAVATASAQNATTSRITTAIDNNNLVRLSGNVHPYARAEFDQGRVSDATYFTRMLLLLSRSPEQEDALRKFIDEQHTSGSPNFKKWLTPQEIAERFGPSDADVQTVSAWLTTSGFRVDSISAARTVIAFSGTADRVQQAFRTQLHRYSINGKDFAANSTDPQIPAALSPVISGVVSLNNFPRRPLSHRVGAFQVNADGTVQPAYTLNNGSSTYYAVAPGDFATIYNTKPLLQAGTNGAGQTIGIIGRTNIRLQDVSDFRNLFCLGPGNTSVVIDGTDPGIVNGDEFESLLDTEWANGVAPGANVVLYTAQDTDTTSGIDLAALRAVNDNVASVISVSYGQCEAFLGTTENTFLHTLWQQAAAQGITVMVSAGDSGSAGCDDQNVESFAVAGLGVNGLASSAYNVAVGGTDFDDAGTQTSYWQRANNPGSRSSALSYIPEKTWNSTCATSARPGVLNVCPALIDPNLALWAGSGGASNCALVDVSGSCVSGVPKPVWQSGTGVPADGVRDLPDVSLFSSVGTSSNSFYVVCQADALPPGYISCSPSNPSFLGAGGTSAAAPSFAAIVALAVQKSGTRVGNVNYLLYSLAARLGSSCTSSASRSSSCIFNDVVNGNISVPCKPGSPSCSLLSGSIAGVVVDSSRQPAYMASAGYDLATGLGSVNAESLVNSIANAMKGGTPTTTSLTLNGSTGAVTAHHGDSMSVGITVSPNASSGNVAVLGKSAGIDSHNLSSGTAIWNSTLFPGGTYTVTAHYAGDGTFGASDSNGIPVTISPEAGKIFVNLITFDVNGMPQDHTANTVTYGAPYIMRVEVADSAATVSSAQGVTSKCSTGAASCATGTVNVTANGAPVDGGLFRLNNKGFAEDWFIQLGGGSYNLAASYGGDPSYGAASGSSAITVAKAATSITASTGLVGSAEYGVSFQIDGQITTASSGAGPTGTVNFQDNGGASNISAFLLSHAATDTAYAGANYTTLGYVTSLGDHALVAQYTGDANYSGSTAAAFHVNVVPARTFAINSSIIPNVATPSIPVSLMARFSSAGQFGTPTGTVTFFDNGNPVAGTVTYTNPFGGTIVAQLTTNFTGIGTHTLSASYSGDTFFLSATAQLGTLPVSDKLTTVLNTSSSFTPALVNYPTSLVAALGIPHSHQLPPPTGIISFSENGQSLGQVTYSTYDEGYGSASIQGTVPFTFSTTGTHAVIATYSGDSNYAATSSTLNLTVVDKLPTTIVRFDPSNAVVNHPAPVVAVINATNFVANDPVMSGTVVFQDGSTPMTETQNVTTGPGSLTANSQHSFTTPGTHTVTVQYSGDSHYAAQSKTFSVDVLGPLALRLSYTTLTTPLTGGSGQVFTSISNNTDNPVTVTVACTPSSSKATCSVLSPINIPANTFTNPVITFTVPSVVGRTRPVFPFTAPFVFASLLAGLGCVKGAKRHRVVALLMFVCLLTLVSCGGGGGSSGGTSGGGTLNPRTYTFTVTVSGGGNTDSQTFTVNLQ